MREEPELKPLELKPLEFKPPGECEGMPDIRAQIDAIDERVIALLGLRFEYVQAAAPFKSSAQSVRAPERFAAMIEQRRQWAQREGLSPDIIEQIYRALVEYFIAREMAQWQQQSPGSEGA
jgi:isochorismate pyruvate lyase